MAPPRVVVLSLDPLARSGLSALLAGRSEVAVVGQASPGDAGAVPALAAEVVLLDAAAGGAAHLRDLPAAIPVVALVADEAQAAEALAAGARGAVLRDAAPERLAAALAAAHAGLLPLDPALADWIRPPALAAGEQEPLTPREAEVLALLAEGLPNKTIARRLGVAERTAKFHVESILGKLGAESRSEAIVLAARRGLVTL